MDKKTIIQQHDIDFFSSFMLLKDILINEPLSAHTFVQIGGKADVLLLPRSVKEVARIRKYAFENSIPFTLLGYGSNLIIRDNGIRGIVVSLIHLQEVNIVDDVLYVQAGASLIEVSKIAAENSLSGLEFACGIPGSIGGAVYMNAGAYEGEIKDVLQDVFVMEPTGTVKRKTKEQMNFSYRYSNIREANEIVLGVSFTLQIGEQATILEKMADLTRLREEKQPLEYPSCGSVFKRPKGFYTGKLIQDAGLQGYRIGGAEVSRKHAGFIVNHGGAKAKDYLDVIAHIQTIIFELYGVKLETEVEIIGEP